MYYVIVSGGVISGLGKGITASSIGLLLQSHGFDVTAIKIDPYLNVDSGTMSPFEHGECYVLDDGGETDLDLGNYERFLGINLTKAHSLTSGKVYKSVIDKERKGDYLGQTVQILPHVTDFIQSYISDTAKIPVDGDKVPNVCIIELGGTVGDHEGNIYMEALSEFSKSNNCCFVHVSLVPVIHGNEIKTKPTQHSMKCIRSMGVDPDLLILRCERMLTQSETAKMSKFCKIGSDRIIINENVPTIYEVPRLFYKQSIMKTMFKVLGINPDVVQQADLSKYYSLLSHFSDNASSPICTVGIVGKYIGMQDTYLSLIRALDHASYVKKCRLVIQWVDSEDIGTLESKLGTVDGVIIPGGFGDRGIEGMVLAAKLCRERRIPLFGICLGMQIMCIELDRNVLGCVGATSEEFDPNAIYKTVVLSEAKTDMGATMRLGSYVCRIENGSLAKRLYGSDTISERHRHRYEISDRFVNLLTRNSSFKVTGRDTSGRYVEMIENGEIDDSPFWLGCQFHPEFKSRHSIGHPLFVGFLSSCLVDRK